jgi:4-diphosphocytidyl-2-C-methyl-D-erythritol kinase
VTTTAGVFPAPAKLNLFLHVIGRRKDGYHLLQTAYRFIDYGDELSFVVRADGAVRRTTPMQGVPAEQDLSVRAAQALQQETGCREGADIGIVKRLPMGGGLGGGSSDAATTLIALNRLWRTGLTRDRLQQLALTLGADVPVFVFGKNAFAEGIGERLQALLLPPAWYLILVPELAVSTAEIFSDAELTRNTNAITIAPFSVGQGRNDLEPVVCRRYPQVARHLEWLRRYGDARMTGSGACVFCAFDSEEHVRRVLSELPADMRGFVARGLDRHPLWSEDD